MFIVSTSSKTLASLHSIRPCLYMLAITASFEQCLSPGHGLILSLVYYIPPTSPILQSNAKRDEVSFSLEPEDTLHNDITPLSSSQIWLDASLKMCPGWGRHSSNIYTVGTTLVPPSGSAGQERFQLSYKCLQEGKLRFDHDDGELFNGLTEWQWTPSLRQWSILWEEASP